MFLRSVSVQVEEEEVSAPVKSDKKKPVQKKVEIPEDDEEEDGLEVGLK